MKAHKAVLAISSAYFKALFSGNWAETCDGCIEADSPSGVMALLLGYIYMGEWYTKTNIYKDQQACIRLWELSIYYQVPGLTGMIGSQCIEETTVDNLINLLAVVDKFPDQTEMKSDCFAFIRSNTGELLGNPDINQFAVSHPELWEEVRTFLLNHNCIPRKRKIINAAQMKHITKLGDYITSVSSDED